METWHSYWPQKVTGSLEISDLLYDPKVHGDLCGRFDFMTPKAKGHGDLFGKFDLVYDPKRSQGH